MSDEQRQEHRFSPRPEAHAMTWGSLLPPVRKAVHDLLMRIAGAEEARRAGALPDAPHRPQALSNCFLVYGSRGTGKTTVLLSAQRAVLHGADSPGFFDAAPRHGHQDPLLQAARGHAQALSADKHIVWLEPLDLEPLPRTTNLLTTLLTRVRNALDAGDGPHAAARDRLSSASIYEEAGDDARQLLDRLINDATLMWEEIQEPDTRNKAQRQRAAADIYASFRPTFERAMDALSRRLDLRHGHDQGCSILLPIDNIDRSTEHLKSIVKLAQMVSHPCLWLVMAGDRVEVETFLERAFWTELIQGREGADARGKAGESGEDETLGMARRQGHATAQKVWPPSHRVEVDYVEPADTLAFRPPGDEQAPTLQNLLSQVPVKCFMARRGLSREPVDRDDFHEFMLIRLFVVEPGQDAAGRPALTLAGNEALRLPARNVLDLWQLARWVAANPHKPLGAVKIARTMLRSTAAGSSLPSGMGQRLQNEIIRRDPEGGTLLNFDKVRLAVRGRLSIATAVGVIVPPRLEGEGDGEGRVAIRSALRARRSNDMRVVLALEADGNSIKLPDLAAAWLAILYDILIYEPRLAVLGTVSIDIPLVQVSHDLVPTGPVAKRRRQLDLHWKAPRYSTFHAYDVFWRHWEAYLQHQASLCRGQGDQDEPPCATQLALGWLHAALQTFIETSPHSEDMGVTRLTVGPLRPGPVLELAARLYDQYLDETDEPLTRRKTFDSTELCDWLKHALPMLFSQAYAPGSAPTPCRQQLKAWISRPRDSRLVKDWKDNQLFLQADLDMKLDESTPSLQDLLADTRHTLQTWARCGLDEALR